MKAVRLPDGKSFALQGAVWSANYPLSRLDETIELYSRLKLRRGGRYRQHYADTLEALKKLKKEMDA
ncbi:hypothetical protein [uncultured Roseobacter sp.]|uniref:hypothetical protein n=1 Tax=uncultured Roseobacter sp. TaxID=114847 RepID=UPI002639D091|nr:hypothetical protein [uncultured Roseobacter sp.]